MDPSPTDRPLRILSLDGGGIRGLAWLFVLQDLMHRIKVQEKLAMTPLPCEWFDLIVGTSTGGLIALMLGRLEMSVSAAIDAYKVLAAEISSDSSGGGRGTCCAFITTGISAKSWLIKAIRVSSASRCSAEKLKGALLKIAGDEKLADPEPEPICRVAVVAVIQVAAANQPDLLRTYTTGVPPYCCTVLEAARATYAAMTSFPPVKVQIRHGLHVTYLDGGLGYNNPTSLALNEAQQIWGGGRDLGCIVSIGTGISALVRFESNKRRKLLDTLKDSHAVHMSTVCRVSVMQKCMYFRFDPPTDLASIGMDEWEKLDDVAQLAHVYVQGEHSKFNECIAAITHQ